MDAVLVEVMLAIVEPRNTVGRDVGTRGLEILVLIEVSALERKIFDGDPKKFGLVD